MAIIMNFLFMIFFILFSNANNQEIIESTSYITNSKPMSTICQHLTTLCGEERRRIERRMSIYFTWFPIHGLGEPNI